MLCSFFGLSFPKYAACLIDADKNAYSDFDSKPFSNKDGAIAMTVVFDITRIAFFFLPHHL